MVLLRVGEGLSGCAPPRRSMYWAATKVAAKHARGRVWGRRKQSAPVRRPVIVFAYSTTAKISGGCSFSLRVPLVLLSAVPLCITLSREGVPSA